MTHARVAGAGAVLLLAFGGGCHPKSDPEITDGYTDSASGAGPGTTGIQTESSDGPVMTTTESSATATTTDETSGTPYGCGDGAPERDIYCFQEKTFPEVLCERKVAADLNSDGHLDLAVKLDDKVQILFGDGSGDLIKSSEKSLGELILSDVVFSALDIDGDADTDLQVITDIKLFDLRNIGGGLFAQPIVHNFPFISSPLVLVDVSADGLPDVVASVLFENEPQLRIYHNDGVTFTSTPFAVALPGCYGTALIAGSLDADPLPDVLVTSSCNTPGDKAALTSLRNAGDKTLEKLGMFDAGRDPIDIALGDVDEDLFDDALIANQAGGDISVMRGLGDGKFAPEVRIGGLCDGCTMLRSLKGADLDGTGLSDEIVATASVGKPGLRMVAILDPLAPEPTVLVVHQAVLSMIEIGDWNEDGVSDIAFSNADLSLGILQSNP